MSNIALLKRYDEFAVIPLDEFGFVQNRFYLILIDFPRAEGGEEDASQKHIEKQPVCSVGKEGQSDRCQQRVSQICDDIN